MLLNIENLVANNNSMDKNLILFVAASRFQFPNLLLMYAYIKAVLITLK